ncbi:MAG TPA: Rod shape-determining protein MreD [Cytophagales bacterium]|nr:Rod shape-determining protein MreD [Cytophagales bacterium]
MNRGVVSYIFYFIVYLTAQVLLVRNLVLMNFAFCYIYIAFLLLIPLEISPILYMLIGFATGVTTDYFYNTMGIHTAACVLITYLRPFIVRFLTPRGGYEQNVEPTLKSMGLEWFIVYSSIFILIHHIALFYIEASEISLFFFTFGKVIMSSLFTLIILIVTQYLFYSPRKS